LAQSQKCWTESTLTVLVDDGGREPSTLIGLIGRTAIGQSSRPPASCAVVIDGEVVAIDAAGRSHFDAMRIAFPLGAAASCSSPST
jgi:hypothetical protein